MTTRRNVASRANCRLARALLIASILGVGLFAAPFWSGRAAADFSVCYSDPVVLLSDGTVVDLSATINDSASDVTQITYVLHAPVGTSVVQVFKTANLLPNVESFQFSADEPAGTYDTATAVATGTPAGVTAWSGVLSPATGQLVYGSASGTSGQTLTIHLVVPAVTVQSAGDN